MVDINALINRLSEMETVEEVRHSVLREISDEELEVLVEEYRKNPDARFSDNLLVTLSVFKR
jgi:hypothetical protein